MKKAIALTLVVLITVILIRTWTFGPPETTAAPPAATLEWNADELAGGLAEALRFPTISNIDASKVDRQVFADFRHYLEQRFTQVFAQLAHETVNGDALLFRWQGSDDSLKPILLLAHQDVVPVIPGTEAQWKHPPFGGVIADGYIWGRGAADDKSGVLGILEAAERALQQGFTPERTIYLAFGHDEEVGGAGARAIAQLLQERGVRLAFLLDEGGVIASDLVPGVKGRVAMIGPGEKGYISLKLTAYGEGGHSSMPPAHTAAGLIGRAVARLEAAPFPATLDYTTDFFRYMGDAVPAYQRLLFANTWLFAPALKSVLSRNHTANAALRTTTAVTMLNGSVKDNVLPIEASAVVNFRILPGESIASVTRRVREVIDDDQIEISEYGFGSEPSAVADANSAGFRVLSEAVRQVCPDVVVTPRLVVGATDARHFANVADNSYRFLGVEVGPEEIQGIHGTNERVAVRSYVEAVRIYYQLILRSAEL